jgi:ribose transport system substrate-binding protein
LPVRGIVEMRISSALSTAKDPILSTIAKVRKYDLSGASRRTFIPILHHAVDVLDILRSRRTGVSLEELHFSCGVPKTSIYRILQTLVHRGYVVQGDRGLFYLEPGSPKKPRFAILRSSTDDLTGQFIYASLKKAAEMYGIHLTLMDLPSSQTSNPNLLCCIVRQKVDLVVFLRCCREDAVGVADKCAATGLPMISVDVPQPHSYYIGVDDYRSGYDGGMLLADHALHHWDGNVDTVLALDPNDPCGPAHGRVVGAWNGLRAKLPGIPNHVFTRISSNLTSQLNPRAWTALFDARQHGAKVLLLSAGSSNSLSVLDWSQTRDARKGIALGFVCCDTPAQTLDLSAYRSPYLVGTTASRTSDYGAAIVENGIAILNRRPTKPYRFIQHELTYKASASPAITCSAAS